MRQTDLELGDSAAAPAYGEVSPGLGALDGNHDLLQQPAVFRFLASASEGTPGAEDHSIAEPVDAVDRSKPCPLELLDKLAEG